MNIIEIENLVKRYGEHLALDHLSLEVKEGEILGLLGPNGSGKTTTINCILSLLNYDQGIIKVRGEDMSPRKLNIKQDIGYVMQNVGVFNELTVYENVDYFCGLYIKDKELRKQYVKEAIEFVDLKEFCKYVPKKLSGGLLRRLNIACGIAHKPKIIILDEPTVAVDPQSRNSILEGIVRLNKEGATILYTSHYMEEVEQICSRIVIIDRGQVIAQGTKDSLKRLSKTGEKIVFEIYQISDALIEELRALDFVSEVHYDGLILTIYCSNGEYLLSRTLEWFRTHDLEFVRVSNELPTLNDVFLEITGKQLRDGL